MQYNTWQQKLKYKIYAVMRAIGLLWLIVWYEQSKLDRALRARFKAFCTSHGLKKINGKWKKID
jgi:hypothetical protein